MNYRLRKFAQLNSRDFLSLLTCFSLSITVLFILSSFFVVASSQLQASPWTDLNRAIGGACYICHSQDYCTTSTPCTQVKDSTTLWYKQTGTGITQKFCVDIEAKGIAGSGYQVCNTHTNKECMKTYTCTDAACTNCGEPAIEQKSTACSFIPGAPCTVPPPGG